MIFHVSEITKEGDSSFDSTPGQQVISLLSARVRRELHDKPRRIPRVLGLDQEMGFNEDTSFAREIGVMSLSPDLVTVCNMQDLSLSYEDAAFAELYSHGIVPSDEADRILNIFSSDIENEIRFIFEHFITENEDVPNIDELERVAMGDGDAVPEYHENFDQYLIYRIASEAFGA